MGDALGDDLERLRAARRKSRRKKHRRSRLDRLRAEVEALSAKGASTYEIQAWLRKHARLKVDQSTVWRALARWKAEGG